MVISSNLSLGTPTTDWVNNPKKSRFSRWSNKKFFVRASTHLLRWFNIPILQMNHCWQVQAVWYDCNWSRERAPDTTWPARPAPFSADPQLIRFILALILDVSLNCLGRQWRSPCAPAARSIPFQFRGLTHSYIPGCTILSNVVYPLRLQSAFSLFAVCVSI